MRGDDPTRGRRAMGANCSAIQASVPLDLGDEGGGVGAFSAHGPLPDLAFASSSAMFASVDHAIVGVLLCVCGSSEVSEPSRIIRGVTPVEATTQHGP